jgi:hypothetical protein
MITARAKTSCWLLCIAIFAVASCGVAAGRASASQLSQLCPQVFSREAASPKSESAAQADAASLLAELPLPPGSSESATEPAEDDSLLAHPGFGPPATPNAVDVHAWWLVPLAPPEALAYICQHLPPGTETGLTGDGLGGPDVPENELAGFEVPGSPGTLALYAVRLPNGSTALRADAQVVWTTPRAASETIPSGSHLLRISRHSESRRANADEPESQKLSMLERLPWTVRSVGQIEAVVGLLNALGVIQPGLRLCPLSLTDTSVQLSFYATPAAAPLAVADIEPGGCGGVSLTIGGVRQPSLQGGWSLISEIGEALAVNPAIGPPVGLTPHISRVRMSRRRFELAQEDIVNTAVEPGTEFLFTLSAPAEVSVAISRLPRGARYAETCAANAERPPRLRREDCQRTVPVTRLTRCTEPEGKDAVAFSGKVGRRALTPGRYVAVLKARNTGGSSPAAHIEFEITR